MTGVTPVPIRCSERRAGTVEPVPEPVAAQEPKVSTEIMSSDATLVEKLCDELLAEFPPASTPARTFLGAQFDKGLAWVQFDIGYGGLGLSPKYQSQIDLKLRAAGAPHPVFANPIGHGMGAPTVYTWGSETQKKRYLRPLFTGEEVWCQLFSEPGAGSDVAGLSTSAVRDGEEWVINGQKVWTTLAHLSRWGMLVARTDPNAQKHKGLSYFVIDMHAPGVEVRPLRQMTGDAEFNEIFMTDVRIPDAERLGEVGDGWRVSLTTLMNERVSIGGAIQARGSGAIALPVKLWQQYGHTDAAKKDQLMSLWVRAEAARLTNLRASQNRKAGVPGPEGSTGKLASAELNKDIYAFCVDLMGPDGLLYDEYTMRRPENAMDLSTPQRAFLRSRANSIEGGTSEVMRNILGERVLGLPGDVRVDKDKSWLEVPRN
jgi:alkylation response protein AidB-like acyl-CoA dehydrogenase